VINKIDFVRLKLFVSQAYQWYAMLFNGPMIIYASWKLTPEVGFFNRQTFIIVVILGMIILAGITFVYFKYIYPVELAYCFKVSPEWQELKKKD